MKASRLKKQSAEYGLAGSKCRTLIAKIDIASARAYFFQSEGVPDMNFSLTPCLEQFVRVRAGSGDYNNASEVVREAKRLIRCGHGTKNASSNPRQDLVKSLH